MTAIDILESKRQTLVSEVDRLVREIESMQSRLKLYVEDLATMVALRADVETAIQKLKIN